MALEKKRISEIPPDAIILSEDKAIKYHYSILNNWKTPSDVFAYNYGAMFLGASTMLVGAYINSHFRRKLRLFSYGRISSYLPICVVPATMTFLLHHELVLKELVLLKQNQCPVCLEVRASAVQSVFGLGMPLVLAPVTSIGLAHRFGTYNVPSILNEPLGVLKLVKKLVKPVKNVLFGVFIVQALFASAVTYFEANSIFKVHSKLAELENTLENSEML